MNETTNIPAILRGKPQGTKLHDLVRGTDVFLNNVVDGCDKVCCTFVKNGSQKLHYSPKGTLVGFEDGMVILVPSETMRDWSKFAWKKGDVLVSNDSDRHIIFKGFSKNDYTTFEGKHWISVSKKRHVFCLGMQNVQDYHIEDNKDSAQTYINTIEEKLGGTLNRETLEIEKQYEFKDGDIAFADYGNRQDVFIVSGITGLSEGYSSFISIDLSSLTLSMGCRTTFFKKDLCKLRLATEEEKKQLFDAIEKDGKAWDAEKKQVVRLQVSGKLYYFKMENELAYIAKLKKAKGGKYTFESNVSWCPRNSTNGYDYEEGSFIVSDKDCYGFREANADECKIFEKFIVEHAMKSFKFKALDYVLAKNITCYESNAWNIFQYAYQNKDGAHIMVGGAAFLQCIPYVGNEDLLGTTKLYSTKK